MIYLGILLLLLGDPALIGLIHASCRGGSLLEEVLYIAVLNILLFMPVLHRFTSLLRLKKERSNIGLKNENRQMADMPSNKKNQPEKSVKDTWIARVILAATFIPIAAGTVLCLYGVFADNFQDFPRILGYAVKLALLILAAIGLWSSGGLFYCILIELTKAARSLVGREDSPAPHQ